MKKTKYRVYMCVNSETSTVYSAHCQCPVGLSETCSHVGALLFALNDYTRKKLHEAPSCTSVLSKWNVPRPVTMEAQPLCNMALNKALYREDGEKAPALKVRKVVTFDPRHSEDRTLDLDRMNHHLSLLKQVYHKSGLEHLHVILDEAQEPACEIEVQDISFELKPYIVSSNSVPPSTISPNLISYIEEITKTQGMSDLWLQLHRGRITSSQFCKVYNAGAQPNYLIREIMQERGLHQYKNLPPAITWGRCNEEKARKKYLQTNGESVTVSLSGLTLSSQYSFLGASGDGIIRDTTMPPGQQYGVLEIKCPYSVQKELVTCKSVREIVSMSKGTPLFVVQDGELNLDQTCQHYCQVQGEMAVKNLLWCDYVVWTTTDIVITRITFNPTFWDLLLHKLIVFHSNFIVPAIQNNE